MSKRIFVIWAAVLLGALLLIMPGAAMIKNIRQRETKYFQTEKMLGWQVSYDKEPDENGIYRIHYKNVLTGLQSGGEVLMFYVYHGDVYAYADGDLLYQLDMNRETVYFPVVLGDTWNCFHVPQKYEGAEIEIIVETKYDSYLEYVPEFYLGDRLNIVRAELQESVVSILLCLIIFAVGIIILIYSRVAAKNHFRQQGITYLGIFALLMATWFLINTRALNLVLDGGSVFTNLSYLILGTVTVPIVLFEKSIMDKRYGRACDILCLLAVCVQLVCVLLQLFGIKDLKQTLVCTHVVFAISVVGLITLLILNMRRNGLKNLSVMNRINVLFGMLTAVGVAIDLVHYYIDYSGGKNYEYTKMAFLVYIIALGYFSIRESLQLLKKGKEAQRFEKMAHMDELTGVFNRMACNEDMKAMELRGNGYMVVMFDLNNLKRCNDTMGHECGDFYIASCAQYIREAFEGIGKCYRIGGDEFCVIGKMAGEEVMEDCYRMLEEKISRYNRTNPQVDMSIAYGHAFFDPAVDEDLKDTRARADKSMYKHKMERKGLMPE